MASFGNTRNNVQAEANFNNAQPSSVYHEDEII
jgi:hypothetical protein